MLGLALLTLAVYAQALGFDFLSNWDDYQYITSNPDIRGFSAQNLVRIFSSSYVGNYAPLHLFSYLVDYQLFGLNPAWFHGVNVALHLACGLLWYALVLRLSGRGLWAFVAAALFLVHPVQVESVAWVTERKNLLALVFSLFSFSSYLSYRQQSGERSHFAYFRCLLFLALALLSKSIAVVMPVVFLLHDLCLEPAPGRKGLWLDKVAPVAVAGLAALLTLATQSAELGGGSVDFFEGDRVAKFCTMATVLTRYLGLLCWPAPSRLNSVYILFVKGGLDAEVALGLGLAAVLAVFGGYLWLRQRRLFFGFGVCVVGLVPVSQLVPLATLMNDRYLYFPMLGVSWLVAGALSGLAERFPAARPNPGQLLAVVLIVPCLLFSYQRCQVWRNAVTLWSDVAGKYPTLRDQRAALAAAYLYADNKQKALETYREVFALKREFNDPLAERKAYFEAARLYLEAGAPDKALPLLVTLTGKFPEFQPGQRLLAECRGRVTKTE
jgi:hypothetical protein